MALEDYFQPFSRRDWERESVDGTVRMAVVGLGGFARNRGLPAIAAGEYCETTTLVSGSPEKAATLAEAFDVQHVVDYEAYKNGAAADAYDAVYVATPNALHGEYVRAAADLGKHVICEKPLETTTERAELVNVCAEAGVMLMTAYRIRFGPTARRTRGSSTTATSATSSRCTAASPIPSWRRRGGYLATRPRPRRRRRARRPRRLPAQYNAVPPEAGPRRGQRLDLLAGAGVRRGRRTRHVHAPVPGPDHRFVYGKFQRARE